MGLDWGRRAAELIVEILKDVPKVVTETLVLGILEGGSLEVTQRQDETGSRLAIPLLKTLPGYASHLDVDGFRFLQKCGQEVHGLGAWG